MLNLTPDVSLDGDTADVRLFDISQDDEQYWWLVGNQVLKCRLPSRSIPLTIEVCPVNEAAKECLRLLAKGWSKDAISDALAEAIRESLTDTAVHEVALEIKSSMGDYGMANLAETLDGLFDEQMPYASLIELLCADWREVKL